MFSFNFVVLIILVCFGLLGLGLGPQGGTDGISWWGEAVAVDFLIPSHRGLLWLGNSYCTGLGGGLLGTIRPRRAL